MNAICKILNELRPRKNDSKYESLIEFVTDRPGHDFRYAIDDSKAERELGYKRIFPQFEDGLRNTIEWYLKNLNWCEVVTAKPGVKVQYDWSKAK